MKKQSVSQKLLKINREWIKLPACWGDNPTWWLFLIVISLFICSNLAYFLKFSTLKISATINILCLYAIYTVNHEAVHRMAHPNRQINNWMGRIAAVMEGTTFPMFSILHSQHHAFTNDPEQDPDYVIGRQPRWLLPVWILVRLIHDNYFMITRRLWFKKNQQFLEHIVTVNLQFLVIIIATAADNIKDVLCLWVLPFLIAGVLIEFTVAWLVHFPHESQHPLENTRLFKGFIWQILMLNQNYHLVHHLFPNIPWFRYGQVVAVVESAIIEHQNQTKHSFKSSDFKLECADKDVDTLAVSPFTNNQNYS